VSRNNLYSNFLRIHALPTTRGAKAPTSSSRRPPCNPLRTCRQSQALPLAGPTSYSQCSALRYCSRYYFPPLVPEDTLPFRLISPIPRSVVPLFAANMYCIPCFLTPVLFTSLFPCCGVANLLNGPPLKLEVSGSVAHEGRNYSAVGLVLVSRLSRRAGEPNVFVTGGLNSHLNRVNVIYDHHRKPLHKELAFDGPFYGLDPDVLNALDRSHLHQTHMTF